MKRAAGISDTRRARERERFRRMRADRSRCSRCGSRDLLPGLRRCAWCRAKDAERKPWLAGMAHDTGLHAIMLEECRASGSRCGATGLALEELAPAGLRLEVDRREPSLGYVRGNMQIVCDRVNRIRQEFGPYLTPDEIAEIRLEVRS